MMTREELEAALAEFEVQWEQSLGAHTISQQTQFMLRDAARERLAQLPYKSGHYPAGIVRRVGDVFRRAMDDPSEFALRKYAEAVLDALGETE